MITEVIGMFSLFKVGRNTGWNIYLESESDSGKTQVGATCMTSAEENECSAAGEHQMSGLEAKAVLVGAVCDSEEYAPGQFYTTCSRGNQFGHAVRAGLDYATVTISDPIAPTSVTGSGIPTSPQNGIISILGSAVDGTAGLLSLAVVDGAGEVVGGPVAAPGACNYSFVTPCPTKVENLSIPVDTTKLPNGQDQVRVEATNAADDEGFSAPYILTVQNEAPSKTGGPGEEKSSGKQENTGKSTTETSGSQTTGSGPTTSTTGTRGAAPIRVLIHIDDLKRTARELLIAGHLDPVAVGTLTGELWHTGSARAVIRRLRLHLTDGRFRIRIPLARALRRRHLTLALRYPGATGYTSARAVRILRPARP
jgi:hypothetical protein